MLAQIVADGKLTILILNLLDEVLDLHVVEVSGELAVGTEQVRAAIPVDVFGKVFTTSVCDVEVFIVLWLNLVEDIVERGVLEVLALGEQFLHSEVLIGVGEHHVTDSCQQDF